ncbi:MAG: hypothetical protein R6X08_08875 [Desulfosalsimonadaceae bacterium]
MAGRSLPLPAAGQGKRVEKDTNEDGKTDQISFFDASSRIQRLEINNNKAPCFSYAPASAVACPVGDKG